MLKRERLFTKEFIALNVITFLAYTNFAVFFQFYSYLNALPIDVNKLGLIIATFSVIAIILRPFIAPLIHPGNARMVLLISNTAVILSLLGYNLAHDFWSMMIVRSIHGAAHVFLATSLTVALVNVIPKSRSGQAFGLMTVIMLLPFGVIPPLLDFAIKHFGGFLPVLAATAAFMLLIYPLSLAARKPDNMEKEEVVEKLVFREMVKDLKDRRVFLLLAIMLLLYSGYAPVFFFIETYARNMNISNPGIFFTLSTFCEIAVRLAAGSLFDKGNKVLMAGVGLVAIGLAYAALAHVSDIYMYVMLGIFLGIGWGVVMPVLNALLFDISPERLRGLNTNLGLEMFQGGYFVGPLVGGLILAGWNYTILYYFCGLLTVLAAALTLPLIAMRNK